MLKTALCPARTTFPIAPRAFSSPFPSFLQSRPFCREKEAVKSGLSAVTEPILSQLAGTVEWQQSACWRTGARAQLSFRGLEQLATAAGASEPGGAAGGAAACQAEPSRAAVISRPLMMLSKLQNWSIGNPKADQSIFHCSLPLRWESGCTPGGSPAPPRHSDSHRFGSCPVSRLDLIRVQVIYPVTCHFNAIPPFWSVNQVLM